jgi:hypothetical protein
MGVGCDGFDAAFYVYTAIELFCNRRVQSMLHIA